MGSVPTHQHDRVLANAVQDHDQALAWIQWSNQRPLDRGHGVIARRTPADGVAVVICCQWQVGKADTRKGLNGYLQSLTVGGVHPVDRAGDIDLHIAADGTVALDVEVCYLLGAQRVLGAV